MARKLNPAKLQRQNNAVLQVLNRRPSAPAATLYLMQLRAQALKISPPLRRVRLEISAETMVEDPQPVKIVRIDEE
jgi:hypothetical protein